MTAEKEQKNFFLCRNGARNSRFLGSGNQSFSGLLRIRRIRNLIFYDGPPFCYGTTTSRAFVASTIKDVVPRYWTMRVAT